MRAGISINVIRDGRKVFLVEIKDLSIQFIRSNNYFKLNEFQLADMFQISNKKIFFPIRLRDNQHTTDKIPDVNYFFDFKDSKEERLQKLLFVNELKQLQKKWIYEKELQLFAEEKLRLLSLSFLKFIEESFKLQTQIRSGDSQNEILIHPVSKNVCTISAFIFKVYRLFYLNSYPIFSIKNEFGLSTKHSSAKEYEFSKYFEFKFPEKKFRSIFSHKLGQKVFAQGMPDLYSEKTGEIINLNGCFFHGHSNCLINKKASPQTVHPIFNKTFEEMNKDYENKMASLIENNSEIKSIQTIWECQYNQMRQSDEFQFFYKNHLKPRPLYRLSVRESIRGGFNDCFALKWMQSENLNESFQVLDMNMQYSFIAMTKQFFVGKYDIVIGKEIENISYKNGNFYLKGNSKPVNGLMQISILPPKNLFYPFLPIKLKNEKTVFTLCFQCAEKMSKKCAHCDEERALTSVYYVSEILFAISLGYKILEIYECYFFEKSEFILKSFVEKLVFLRLKHSNIFKGCKSSQEQSEYCDFLNLEMDLKPPFSLTPENVTPNEQKKQFYKEMINSIFGKLEQRSDKPKTVFVYSQTELEDIYFSDSKILNILCINDQTVQLSVKSNLDKVLPNRETNIGLGGQLVSFARMLIYEKIIEIDKIGKVFYSDCDSIFFSLPKNESIPLQISDSVGHFKYVYPPGSISSFICLSPKNYMVSYEIEGKIKTISKIKGISLSSFYLKNEINCATFNYFISKSLSEEIEKKHLVQLKFNKEKKNPKLQLLKHTNAITSRRITFKNCKYFTTFPYGNENI